MSVVVCPHCHGSNRIANDKCHADSGAVCGHCKQSLFDGSVIEAEVMSFNKHLTRSELPIVVDFWAPWCGPCQAMGPILEELSKELAGKAKIGKLNVDENQATAQAYAIMSIPSLKIFKGGKVVKEFVGMQAKETLKSALETV